VARILALLGVVAGHLTLAVIDHGPDGALRGTNLLAIRPGWGWIAMLSPMAIFFAAAGWANAHGTLRSAAPRLRSLIGLAAEVVSVWVGVAWAVKLATGDGRVLVDGARIATQPLWFLAAYVPLTAGSPAVARLARRPVAAVAGCLIMLAILDAARFGPGIPSWIGWLGFFVAWSVPWIVGTAWRSRVEAGSGFDERRVGVGLLVGGAVAAYLLVRLGGYSAALIDAIPGSRSNTNPPTLYTAVAGLSQVGLLMITARWLDRAGTRWRRWWNLAGEAAVGVYALHLSALALCAGVIALGLPVPMRLTGGWWASRPLWFGVVLGLTGLLAWCAALIRTWVAGQAPPRTGPPATAAVLRTGAGLATIGGAVIGMRGPRTPLTATACVLTLIGSWLLLAPRGRRPSMRAPDDAQRLP